MNDLHHQFDELDQLGEPRPWDEIRRPESEIPTPKVKTSRWAAVTIGLLLAASSIGVASWGLSKIQGEPPPPGASRTGGVAKAECTDGFESIARPIAHDDVAALSDLWAVNDADVWAVGKSGHLRIASEEPPDALLFHGDPAGWRAVRAAVVEGTVDTFAGDSEVEGRIGYLEGVSGDAPDDVWAVGHIGRALIEHWDGRRWSNVEGAGNGHLLDVVAFRRNLAWAVGKADNGQPLALLWNGRRWDRVVTPLLPSGGSFYGVSGNSADDIWAVGEQESPGGGSSPLIERWDGHSWRPVPSPAVTSSEWYRLEAVATLATDDIWAVGWNAPLDAVSDNRPLIAHFDGEAWQTVPISHLADDQVGGLSSVAAVSPSEVWAVGTAHLPDRHFEPLVVHWDGKKWARVLVRDAPPDTGLLAVAASPSGRVWAAGTALRGERSQTVLLQRDCSPLPRTAPK